MFKEYNLLSVLRAGVDWIVCSPWRSFIVIFLLSFTIRVNLLNQVDRRYLVPTDDRELGAIAISLMKTGEFADPYIIPTGPTAHLPPVPPMKDSLIYRALKLIELGEVEYMRQAGSEALEWISAHPVESLRLIVQRFANLWAGPVYLPVENYIGVLALTLLAIVGAWLSFPRITVPQRAAFLIPLVTYPLIHYIVAYMPATEYQSIGFCIPWQALRSGAG